MSDKITVACKLPHGLILRLFDMVDDTEATQGGFRKMKRAQVKEGQVVIKGYLERYNTKKDNPPMAKTSSFALTHDVDREFFEKWLKQNETLPAVRNGLIYAHVDMDMIRGHVLEHEKVRNGLEPLDPDNLPRAFEGKIQRGDREAA